MVRNISARTRANVSASGAAIRAAGGQTAGDIIRASRAEASRTGKSEISIIQQRSEAENRRTGGGRATSAPSDISSFAQIVQPTAGEEVRAAREVSKSTGISELAVLRLISAGRESPLTQKEIIAEAGILRRFEPRLT